MSALLTALLLGVCVLSLAPVTNVSAGGDQLADIRARQAALRAQLSGLHAQSVLTSQQLQALNLQLANNSAAMASTKRELGAINASLAAVNAQLSQDRAKLDLAATNYGQLLRLNYLQHPNGMMGVALGATSFSDLVERVSGWTVIENVQARNVKALKEAEAAIAATKSVQDVQQTLSQSLLANLQVRQSQLDTQAAERNAAYASFTAAEAEGAVTLQQLDLQALAIQIGAAGQPVSRSGTGAVDLGTFQITAYSLPGHTASGLPVGYGIVAVDPNLIPLGTRLYVDGYGNCLAADTGGAVLGRHIDIWLPSYSQAIQWGIQYRSVQEYR